MRRAALGKQADCVGERSLFHSLLFLVQILQAQSEEEKAEWMERIKGVFGDRSAHPSMHAVSQAALAASRLSAMGGGAGSHSREGPSLRAAAGSSYSLMSD